MPITKKFKRWIVEDVIPSIRKYGVYEISKIDKNKMNKLIIK
jgi:prophage antirepressor-like protein